MQKASGEQCYEESNRLRSTPMVYIKLSGQVEENGREVEYHTVRLDEALF